MPPRLVAIAGPLAGQTFALGAAALTLGRDRGCAVHLRDLAVSRQHCLVEAADGRFRLRDLESRHGTFVNGVPVRERALEEGDLITLGASAFLFQTADESSGTGAPVVLTDGDYIAESTVHLAAEDARYLKATADAAAQAQSARTARDLQALLRIGNALHALRAAAPRSRPFAEQLSGKMLLLAREGRPFHETLDQKP